MGKRITLCWQGSQGRRQPALCSQWGQAYSHSPAAVRATSAAARLPPVPMLHSVVKGPRDTDFWATGLRGILWSFCPQSSGSRTLHF